MRYPGLSELDPEQLRAIGEAKSQGSALFHKDGITYVIAEMARNSVIKAHDATGHEAGYIITSQFGKHYAIEVPSEFRGKGIGTTLLKTKEALDGILNHEWSGRYSRIYFLIKKGYVPVAKISEYEQTSLDKPITKGDLDFLIQKLRQHYQEHLSGDSINDVSPLVFRMKYSPGKAREFIRKNNLE